MESVAEMKAILRPRLPFLRVWFARETCFWMCAAWEDVKVKIWRSSCGPDVLMRS
jgi:hypothetical protein